MLWGTVSEEIRDSPASVQQYFDYYASLDSLSVVEGSYQPSIRVFGDVAISSGTSTFRYTEGGVERLVPQRFTFVYRRSADSAVGWEIVDHHSSQVRIRVRTRTRSLLFGACQARTAYRSAPRDAAHTSTRPNNRARSRAQVPAQPDGLAETMAAAGQLRGGWVMPNSDLIRQTYRHYMTAGGWTGPTVVAGTAPRQAYRHYTTASGWTGVSERGSHRPTGPPPLSLYPPRKSPPTPPPPPTPHPAGLMQLGYADAQYPLCPRIGPRDEALRQEAPIMSRG